MCRCYTCQAHCGIKKLASALVKARFAACVQLSDTLSFYTWEGNVVKDNEVRLTIKAKKAWYR